MLLYLQNIKLTLTQWALLTMAFIIGILVFELKLKGGALAKANVALLQAHYDSINQADEAAVAAAKLRLARAAEQL